MVDNLSELAHEIVFLVVREEPANFQLRAAADQGNRFAVPGVTWGINEKSGKTAIECQTLRWLVDPFFENELRLR